MLHRPRKTSIGFGSEGIAGYFLKIAFTVITSSLCKILTFPSRVGFFPDTWKKARVSLVSIGGNADDYWNYRPISVLPFISRVLEKLIYDQLYKHLNSNKLLYSNQYCFRQLHSVVACLLKPT